MTRQEAEKLAGTYRMRYVETSARDAINVEHAFTELTRDIFALVRSGDITIQEGWEGVKSGFVPNVVHSSEEVTKSDRRCLCWSGGVLQLKLKRGKGCRKDLEGGMDWGNSPETEIKNTVSIPLLFFSSAGYIGKLTKTWEKAEQNIWSIVAISIYPVSLREEGSQMLI